jgi:hypothetical protein
LSSSVLFPFSHLDLQKKNAGMFALSLIYILADQFTLRLNTDFLTKLTNKQMRIGKKEYFVTLGGKII